MFTLFNGVCKQNIKIKVVWYSSEQKGSTRTNSSVGVYNCWTLQINHSEKQMICRVIIVIPILPKRMLQIK